MTKVWDMASGGYINSIQGGMPNLTFGTYGNESRASGGQAATFGIGAAAGLGSPSAYPGSMSGNPGSFKDPNLLDMAINPISTAADYATGGMASGLVSGVSQAFGVGGGTRITPNEMEDIVSGRKQARIDANSAQGAALGQRRGVEQSASKQSTLQSNIQNAELYGEYVPLATKQAASGNGLKGTYWEDFFNK